MSGYVVHAYVFTDDAATAARAMETLARTSAGLGLDGIRSSVSIGPDEDDDQEAGPG